MAEPSLKILIIGPSNVGKSALLKRYCDEDFDPNDAAATIGIDFRVKRLSVHGKTYRVTLLDTAGQERFRTLSTSYYRGAHGIVFVYDLTNRATFAQMDDWVAEADANTATGTVTRGGGPPSRCHYCVVGAKLDRAATSRAVSTEEGAALARRLGHRRSRGGSSDGEDDSDDGGHDSDNDESEVLFFETSARTGEKVREPFVALVDRIVGASSTATAAATTTSVGTVSLAGAGSGGGYIPGCSC